MFCPNCGKELKIPNQRFCIYCGNDLTIISKTSQSRTDNTQYYIAIPKTKPISADIQIPVSKKERTVYGPHSKKCLGFSLVSIGIGLFAYYFGSNFLTYIFFRSMGFPYSFFHFSESEIKSILFILLIIVFFLHNLGLTLGILSRVESGKAGRLEPINSVERAGSVFGIFGIITNAIALIVTLIMPVFIF